MLSRKTLVRITQEGGRYQISPFDQVLYRQIEKRVTNRSKKAIENLQWLLQNMHPYFFITMKDEVDSIVHLASRLDDIAAEKRLVLTEQEKKLIIARLDVKGSIYDTLKALIERDISYAEMSHSYSTIPGIGRYLEIQRYEFNRKSDEEILKTPPFLIPSKIISSVRGLMKALYPQYDFKDFESAMRLLWSNNERYVRISPADRIARVLWVFQQSKKHDGLFFDAETKENDMHRKESRLLFSVANPPHKGFLTQVSEIFQRLGLGVRRSYCLIVSTGRHSYFLGNFYVLTHDNRLVEKDSSLFQKLQMEFYNTQILSSSSFAYTGFVANLMMTGEEAALTNAFAGFCHTILAHNAPDRFDADMVNNAFQSSPDITIKLTSLFKQRFDPDQKGIQEDYEKNVKGIWQAIEEYNTGHRYLDEIRKTIFNVCLTFVTHTLKTNFFVPEKHALAFRLDPRFLLDLAPQFRSDLPQAMPFRITFFFSRYTVGYHVGFSDIARGGWRTILCKTPDELTTNMNNLFREVFVLAHTQHLKNKDIYEGGSKLTVVLDAVGIDSPALITQRLYKAQYGVINAFLDIHVTEGGRARHPRVVDYYQEDEPIELGPDENLHDATIELIAQQSVKRGYILGMGIISSKKIGINHREYGVTSRGVVKFAELAMREVGIDIRHDPFTVRFTGGPNGDVAGNAMRFLFEKCSLVSILSIVDGTAGLYDPKGAAKKELQRLILTHDLDQFRPEALHLDGFILYREGCRKEDLRQLYRKILRTKNGLEEKWLTTDEFHKELDDLIFSIPTDLFLPCGGRPETIDQHNSQRLFDSLGHPTVKVITEGANSFFTPEARSEIQERGVIILRDASANKCGVISSSYEIIANLLLTEKEFLAHKESYVRDVIAIFEKRVEEEANLIFKRHREAQGKLLYTDISNALSNEINEHYAKLFQFFQDHPNFSEQHHHLKVIWNHLPALVRENPKFRSRVKTLPQKIRHAILAAEIATRIVYYGAWEEDFSSRINEYVKCQFPAY